MYRYRCKVVRVVDGDTVDVDIDLGFGIWMRKQRIRMLGIDTPESRTRDKVEKQYGLAAKAFLKKELGTSPILETTKDGKGKFGRILGTFYATVPEDDHPECDRFFANVNINEWMIANYHAVAYHGQSKELIEEEHLRNREFVSIQS